MSHDSSSDPLEFVRNMWGNMGFSLPGMVTPTLDVDELDKRIEDMKAVEGWLKMNLNMLQMSIQGLEMQRATLSAIKAMGEATRQKGPEASESSGTGGAFNNAALWSWLQAMSGGAAASEPAAAEPDEAAAEAPVPENSGNPFVDAATAATNAAASAAMWPWQMMSEKSPESPATPAAAPAKKPAAKKPATRSRSKTATGTAAPRKRSTTAKKAPAAPSTRKKA
ncbi:PhaM family polyhydroxyalkanoate granule multifunctional regulatory protein [Denitromonas iodatirespirans]|uniref:PhaM family polyhydroxyalkanoate granule multifunctional regulatory protein n=1 Tax=Denitromonas iodatirespirans TaxID=2795389 RepID=UPI00351D6FE2